jgi:predicted dinucleotide-binding enzyme
MRIGIVGAGRIGTTVAGLWVAAGHEVCLASRHPETLKATVAGLGAGASAGTLDEAARFGDVVMVTVPLSAIPELARSIGSALAGKTVIDTCNAYANRDGALAVEAIRHPAGSAGWAAEKFPGAHWVKAFNSVYFKTLQSEAHRKGDRLGIPIAGDDGSALTVVEALVRDAGFDPVVVGPLRRGKEFEPDTPVYNTGMSGPELRRALGSG